MTLMLNSKIAWLESQYLYPHHFQQQERYLEALLEARCAAISPYVWGFHKLNIDSGALAEGRVSIVAASGILPDGTPFDLPATAPLPIPVAVPASIKDQLVYLVLPIYQAGTLHLDATASGSSDRIARYRLRMLDVFDYAADAPKSEQVESAMLNFGLALEQQDLGGYSVLPIARVREVTPEGAVILESAFVPSVINVRGSPRLDAWLIDVIGQVRQRAEALAARFNQSGGNSAIADFLLLQLLNRTEPRLRHIHSLRQLHPEALYMELLGLMGELATFTTDSKRPAELPGYNHDELQSCFQPLLDRLGGHLSAVLEQTAVALPVEERQFGIHVARIVDRSLLRQAEFVLSVRADLATDILREQVPNTVKVGSVETIRDLVNNQLPGIGLRSLAMAPREIPFHAGAVYFGLDSRCEQWQQLRNSGGFALHVAGDYPALKIELWAIRR